MQRILQFLKKHNASSVAIFSHIRGDGDCLGAQAGLAEILFSAGLTVALYNQEAISTNFSFLPHYHGIQPATIEANVADVCIAVDCATFERIGELPEQFLNRPWINIDHHISNSMFGNLNFVDGEASSTCEIIARMVVDNELSLTPLAATALFTGISTDTGSFLYPSATAQTFYIAAKLLECGANKNLVQANIFENTSKEKIRVLQFLYANIQYLENDSIAYCVFSQNTMQDLKISILDLEGIVSLIKEIQGVEVAVLFTELENQICKVSLRSRDWFDCNYCCNIFGGGGHIRASGATLDQPLASAVSAVLKEIIFEWEEAQHVK
ncbi:MAG: bifunctional oligoribonuclease/PAP phosphatase NrnA [Peptococcaceae bacterium]|nr:bifunctional oligoribonuclease/PAP phosphatase NrnA [Peptococcaceae bacterium]